MAVTTQNSDLMANVLASPQVLNKNNQSKAKLCAEVFSFAQAGAGDANSLIRLCKLPPRARYLGELSRVRFSDWGAGTTMDIGWEAYTNPHTGAAIAADPNGLADGIDTDGAAGVVFLADAPTSSVKDKEFENEVVLTAQVVGAAIPDEATLTGVIVYALP